MPDALDDLNEQFRKLREEEYQAGREEWAEREARLPEHFREQIEEFRRQGGEEFDINAWRYELAIREGATVLVETNGEDTEEFWAWVKREAPTVHMVYMARVISQAYLNGVTDPIPSSLTPLTGKKDYRP